MQTNITDLKNECENLENEVARLEKEIVDMILGDEEELKQEKTTH